MGASMGNEIFDHIVDELEFLGDIFSTGIVKKGITKQGAVPDTVTSDQMRAALDDHIVPALRSFVNPAKAKKVRAEILTFLKDR